MGVPIPIGIGRVDKEEMLLPEDLLQSKSYGQKLGVTAWKTVYLNPRRQAVFGQTHRYRQSRHTCIASGIGILNK